MKLQSIGLGQEDSSTVVVWLLEPLGVQSVTVPCIILNLPRHILRILLDLKLLFLETLFRPKVYF